jgi:hypothetical protein
MMGQIESGSQDSIKQTSARDPHDAEANPFRPESRDKEVSYERTTKFSRIYHV